MPDPMLRCDHGKTAMEFCRRCDPLSLLRGRYRRDRRVWRRWKVQGFLTSAVTGEQDHLGYAPRCFFTRHAAVAFGRRLYRDHGPGMVRVDITRVS